MHRNRQVGEDAALVSDRGDGGVGGAAHGREQRSKGAALSTRRRMGAMLRGVRGAGQVVVGVRLRAQLRDQDDQRQRYRPTCMSLSPE